MTKAGATLRSVGRTQCEWDSEAALLSIVFASNDVPTAPLFAIAFIGRSRVFLGEIPAHCGYGVFRAEADWTRFTLALFEEDAEPLTESRRARWRFSFDRSLAYDPAREEGPDWRTTLRFLRPAPLADATASGLEALAGPEIADGATAGAYLETLASEHHSDPAAEPFAAQAIVRARTDDGMAQGPAAIAYPDPAEPLEVHFGWAEESYEADADILLLRGFETSRAPMVDIDLTRFSEHAERVAQSFVFLHAPLTGDGYSQDWALARGEVLADQAAGRRVLRHIWSEAQHRDLIGVARKNSLPLRAGGALRGLGDRDYPPTQSIGALYLGETLRPEPNEQSTETLAAQVAQALTHAAAAAHGFDEAEAATAFGMTWAQRAASAPELGAPLDLGGSATAAPGTVELFLALSREAIRATGATQQALGRLVGTPFDFETFKRDADLIWALLRFPDLAVNVLETFADERLRQGPAPRRLAGAMFDVEAWWDGLAIAEAPPAWRLLRSGVDLRRLRDKQFVLEAGLPAPEIVNAALAAGAEESADLDRARRVLSDLGKEFAAEGSADTLSEAVRRAQAIDDARQALDAEAEALRAAFQAADLPNIPTNQELWDKMARPFSPPARGDALAALASQNRALRDVLEALRIRSVRSAAQRLLSAENLASEKLEPFLGGLSAALHLPKALDRIAMRHEIAALEDFAALKKTPPAWRSAWARETFDAAKMASHGRLEEAREVLSAAYPEGAGDTPREALEWIAVVQSHRDWIATRELWRRLRRSLDMITHNWSPGDPSPPLAERPVSLSWRAQEAARLKRRMTAPIEQWHNIAEQAEPLLRPTSLASVE
ncbi:MAG: hypothetical protein AAFR28_08050 [Pseudomonadota bacterium]